MCYSADGRRRRAGKRHDDGKARPDDGIVGRNLTTPTSARLQFSSRRPSPFLLSLG